MGLRRWIRSATRRPRDPRARAVLAAALTLGPVLWVVTLPRPEELRWRDPDTTAFVRMRLRAARAAGEPLRLRWTPVPLERISNHLRRAVVVAEDDRFYQHRGIDWRALSEELDYAGDTTFSWWKAEDLGHLADALTTLLERRSELRGRSTLTQQLVKNLYLGPERSFSRKLKELLIARKMERALSKDRILELYLNVAELGPGIFGAEAGAQAHFGVSAERLSPWQAASLAGTLPHPLTSNPSYRPARMAWRRNLILRRLR